MGIEYMQHSDVESFRLSPQQQHLWLVERSSGSTAFWSECEIKVEGDVRPERVMDALARVVERHEVLRTRLEVAPGLLLPVQVVDDRASPLFSTRDLRDLSPAAQAAEIAALQAERRSQPMYGADAASL